MAKEIFCKRLANIVSIRKDPNNKVEVGPNQMMDRNISGMINVEQFMRKTTTTSTATQSNASDLYKYDSQYTKYNDSSKHNDNNQSDVDTIKNYNREREKTIFVCKQSSTTNFASAQINSTVEDWILNLIPKDKLPKSVDLREWGIAGYSWDQGQCGSCYAFTTRYVLLGNFHHDLPYYRKIYSSMENATTGSFKPSVQFILNNSFGFNKYCGGGNFLIAATDHINQHVGSLEHEYQVPYTSMMDSDEEYIDNTIPIKIKTAEFNTTPLVPIHYFNSDQRCPRALIYISAANAQKGFQGDEVVKVKQLLARGVVLSGRMVIGVSSSTCQGCDEKFNVYKSGIAEGDCQTAQSNHQVTYAGYGQYQGKDVWLIINSWGSSWGQNGYFMVEQGKNAFCIEMDVSVVLPRFFGYNLTYENLTVPFNETEMYKENKDTMYKNLFTISVRRGMNGFDSYDASGNPVHTGHNLGYQQWILICILVILVGIWMFYFMKCQCCPNMKHYQKPIHVKLTEKEIEKMNWDDATHSYEYAQRENAIQ